MPEQVRASARSNRTAKGLSSRLRRLRLWRGPRLSLCLVWLGAGLAQALEIHSERHCLLGCPSGSAPANDLIIRDIYIISSNDMTKLADWAAYRVSEATIGRSQRRHWRRDPLLAPNETLAPADYRHAHDTLGTDRGHQVPLAAFSGTDDWSQTNYLSNITPQASGLNQGPWNQLEAAVRRLVTDGHHEAVYVMTGPLYQQSRRPLPEARQAHLVPSDYWKIIAVREADRLHVASFRLSQSLPRQTDYCAHTVPLARLEAASGLTFFHGRDAQPGITMAAPSAPLLADLGCQTE